MNKRAYIFIFLLLELALTVLVQLTSGNFNTILSFLAIVLAFLFSLSGLKGGRECLLTSFALFFTVLADICLVVLSPRRQLLGMICFFVVQICYFVLLLALEERERVRAWHSSIRIVSLGAVSVITAVALGDKTDALALISILYYTNLLVSVIFAFILTRGGGGAVRFLLPVGLLFFAICDAFVGFSEISPYFDIREGTVAYFLANPPFNIAWLFYIPSQAMLALNSIVNKKS